MEGTWARTLVQEDPTYHRATKLLSLCATTTEGLEPRVCTRQKEKPLQWGAWAPQWRAASTLSSWRTPVHSNKDPVQPKINKKLQRNKKKECELLMRTWYPHSTWGLSSLTLSFISSLSTHGQEYSSEKEPGKSRPDCVLQMPNPLS